MTHADQVTTLLQVIADLQTKAKRLQSELDAEKLIKQLYFEKCQALEKAETDNEAESEKA